MPPSPAWLPSWPARARPARPAGPVITIDLQAHDHTADIDRQRNSVDGPLLLKQQQRWSIHINQSGDHAVGTAADRAGPAGG
jgi:hypothetical protein